MAKEKTDWEKRFFDQGVYRDGRLVIPVSDALSLLHEFAEEAARRMYYHCDVITIRSMLPPKED